MFVTAANNFSKWAIICINLNILGNVASSSLAARASGRGRPQGVDPLAAQVLDSFFKICILSRTCLVFLDYDRNIINIGPIFILRTRTTQAAGEEIPLQPIPYEVFKWKPVIFLVLFSWENLRFRIVFNGESPFQRRVNCKIAPNFTIGSITGNWTHHGLGSDAFSRRLVKLSHIDIFLSLRQPQRPRWGRTGTMGLSTATPRTIG